MSIGPDVILFYLAVHAHKICFHLVTPIILGVLRSFSHPNCIPGFILSASRPPDFQASSLIDLTAQTKAGGNTTRAQTKCSTRVQGSVRVRLGLRPLSKHQALGHADQCPTKKKKKKPAPASRSDKQANRAGYRQTQHSD